MTFGYDILTVIFDIIPDTQNAYYKEYAIHMLLFLHCYLITLGYSYSENKTGKECRLEEFL